MREDETIYQNLASLVAQVLQEAYLFPLLLATEHSSRTCNDHYNKHYKLTSLLSLDEGVPSSELIGKRNKNAKIFLKSFFN